jgi:hypothetical protein
MIDLIASSGPTPGDALVALLLRAIESSALWSRLRR